MEKPKIFIASSGRTSLLAESLGEALQTQLCEATLWSEESRRLPAATLIDMLESAGSRYDYAAIVLAKDDVMVKGAGDALKARDNCVFEAGVFMATLGRERCFLISSVAHADLPPDLKGMTFLPFVEPGNLADRNACAAALKDTIETLKGRAQVLGKRILDVRLPTLTVEDVFQRERPHVDGGALREGQVVVCDIQPNIGPDVALQIRRNLMSGVSYLYFLYFGEDTIDKILQGLQIVGAGGADARSADFGQRLETIRTQRDRVLQDLQTICRARNLIICLLPDEPQFCFRVHNASDAEHARLYLRFRARGYLEWAEGSSAVALWRSLPRYLPSDDEQRIFVPMKHFNLAGSEKERLRNCLDRGLNRYFPGMQEEVKQICVGHGAIG